MEPRPVGNDYSFQRQASLLPLPLKYENLPKLAEQRGAVALTKRGDFYCFTQPSKINDVASNELYLGWKAHLSVRQQDLPLAFDIAAPIIRKYDFFFKLVNLNSHHIDDRLKNGAQITIALNQSGTYGSSNFVRKMMQEIQDEFSAQEKFSARQIVPGTMPASDAATFSPYFSLRNDGNTKLVTGIAMEYVSASLAGRNSNPANNANPYKDLLAQPPAPFDPAQHFTLFDIRIDHRDAVSCLQIVLLAYLREYSIIESMNEQEKMQFMSDYCDQDRKNLNADFLKADHKDNPQILCAVRQAFSLVFIFEVDNSWVHGHYYNYVKSAKLSQQYPYGEDSFKQLIQLVEEHAQIESKFYHFDPGLQKLTWMDLYRGKMGMK